MLDLNTLLENTLEFFAPDAPAFRFSGRRKKKKLSKLKTLICPIVLNTGFLRLRVIYSNRGILIIINIPEGLVSNQSTNKEPACPSKG